MIPFNKPPYTGNEDSYVLESLKSDKISGDGKFSVLCQEWFEQKMSCPKALLTPSCTAALEMAAILLNIRDGDEVIMPSYTFVSTANAFVLRGAKIVFVDIRPDTMNIDERLIEAAITKNTRAIVVVHYAGVSCDMQRIMDVAERNSLYVVEDAAQAMMSTYDDRQLGTIGHLGAYSFHETKNYTSAGEGGVLLVNDEEFVERAEIIREKGTNRSKFFRGAVDKYSWVDIGSSYLPSDLQAAYLWGQLKLVNEINSFRKKVWQRYYDELSSIHGIDIPYVPNNCEVNGHMFYIKVKDCMQRSHLIEYMKEQGVVAVFHYVPLHASEAGKLYSKFSGCDRYTTVESERLIRLPLYYGLSEGDQEKVISVVKSYFLAEE